VFKSSRKFAVFSVTPSCINHCVYRDKRYLLSGVATSRSAVYANIAEFTVSFKKIEPIKLWLEMATKAVTFPLCLLFP